MKRVSIILDEKFPHLKNAPIVEAVINFRARPQGPWEEEAVRAAVVPHMEDYPKVLPQYEYEFEQEIQIGKDIPPAPKTKNLGWTGFRLESADGRHIAQFNQNGFVFSRLKPYEDWERLVAEALRLWRIYCDAAKLTQVERTSVRFINRIEMEPEDKDLEHYIMPCPSPMKDLALPFAGFFHSDTLMVPGHPYIVRVIKTLQAATSAGSLPAVIVDIDVLAGDAPISIEPNFLDKRLKEMRWLKNKAFFDSVTEQIVEGFK